MADSQADVGGEVSGMEWSGAQDERHDKMQTLAGRLLDTRPSWVTFANSTPPPQPTIRESGEHWAHLHVYTCTVGYTCLSFCCCWQQSCPAIVARS